MWSFKSKKKPVPSSPPPGPWVDTDQEVVPLRDTKDPTSLMFSITMNHGPSHLTWVEDDRVWRLVVTDRGQWTGTTQMAVLTKAWNDLEGRR